MSLLVSGTTPTEITQGVTGDSVLIVNQSPDVVLVGDRDTLSTRGLSLQPLASIAVKDSKSWWAQSQNPNGSSIDFLFTAEGWSPSPAQIASQITSSTLANAIATAMFNTGSRLVDNTSQAIVTSRAGIANGTFYGMNADGTFALSTIPLLDVRQFQSFVISFFSDVGVAMTLYWFDQNQNVLATRTYENKPNSYTLVYDNHIGPYIGIALANNSGGAAVQLGIQWRFSNRVFNGENIDTINAQDDGTLLAITGTIAAGSNSGTLVVPPIMPGAYGVAVGSGFVGDIRYWNSASTTANRRQFALAVGTNQIFTIPATRRALSLLVENTSASSSTYGLVVFRQYNS